MLGFLDRKKPLRDLGRLPLFSDPVFFSLFSTTIVSSREGPWDKSICEQLPPAPSV